MRIEFLGHAAFMLAFSPNHRILVDPWLTGNPSTTKTLADIPKVDYVFVSHSHEDHGLDDALEICKRDDATLVGVDELVEYARRKGVTKLAGANVGGTFDLENGLQVALTQAIHTSSYGVPVGFVISSHGHTIWYMGDTAFLSDCAYISKKYTIDTLILPAGSRFTMDLLDAFETVKIVQPKNVIPCHYNTFPKINIDIEAFNHLVMTQTYTKPVIMKPGDSVQF
jgi:L-ascorbate metabolism protein UlaG (beta-lactamase superfamily)